eukprot:TRINITY_DN8447_c0_g2_i1.p1 TRINITY_DN8447_c0_g2~~TRINITY_DN8447_c0_g2_i1.p1  ORF type:complete len:174 (-),score=35.61 TRINITY_DN8447_c0_g2_i1:161-634(-)
MANANDKEVLALLKQLRAAQERRPQIYKNLDAAFAALLDSGDLKAYAEATQQITKEFGEVSQAIRHVEDSLKNLTPPWPMAGKIRELQELERTKLSLTSESQILKKEHQDHSDHYEAFEEAEYETQLKRVTGQLRETVEQINEILEEIRFAEFELIE